MMGHHSGNQNRLFYSFHLDDHVPPNHLLRGIDRFLDLSDLRQHLSPYYSHTGRPSIDPELLIRMLIVGYCFGIRSERRLCEEAHLHLADRWVCRPGRFRDSDTLRFVFERVLDRCLREGLVGGEGFAIDASVVKADANRQRGLPGNDIDWSRVSAISRPVREYLAALDEADGEKKVPKNISLTDPAAQWTAAPGGPAFYAYSTNYLVDTHAGIVVDVEATPAYRSDEVNATKTMIDRVEHRLGKKPQRLIGDTAYGTAALLGWMVDEKKIEPHVPVWDKSERSDGTFGRSSFIFDAEHNRYVCPAGKFLKTAWRSRKKDPFRYRASLYDCQPCALKARCSPNMAIRKIDRSPHESARDVARALAKTEAYQQSRKDRKKVEMLFAHLKRILKLDRLRLRGLSGAQDEFLLAATAQNLRRMVKWLAPPAPEPPWIPA